MCDVCLETNVKVNGAVCKRCSTVYRCESAQKAEALLADVKLLGMAFGRMLLTHNNYQQSHQEEGVHHISSMDAPAILMSAFFQAETDKECYADIMRELRDVAESKSRAKRLERVLDQIWLGIGLRALFHVHEEANPIPLSECMLIAFQKSCEGVIFSLE